ncbi:MAG TPA: UMP kinase [Candidatus Megaira endosymbiont of Hartmannula sinica]|nr:UMP kinase [Candidatus Megaera endosymbiont of Hartmannula sinica]
MDLKQEKKIKKTRRVLLKVSGEALMGEQKFGHDHHTLTFIAQDIAKMLEMGVEVAIVVGGGNICRGQITSLLGIDRSSADYMGMLATVINALALQNAITQQGIGARIQSAINISTICEPFIRQKALRHLSKGRVVIFAAGIGNPLFTTDSAAAIRSVEMNCDVLLKGTHVDGVYDSDPKENKGAKKLDKVSYMDVLEKNLKVMDMAAISIAKENNMPIKVFSIKKPGNMINILQDKGSYTIISR